MAVPTVRLIAFWVSKLASLHRGNYYIISIKPCAYSYTYIIIYSSFDFIVHVICHVILQYWGNIPVDPYAHLQTDLHRTPISCSALSHSIPIIGVSHLCSPQPLGQDCMASSSNCAGLLVDCGKAVSEDLYGGTLPSAILHHRPQKGREKKADRGLAAHASHQQMMLSWKTQLNSSNHIRVFPAQEGETAFLPGHSSCMPASEDGHSCPPLLLGLRDLRASVSWGLPLENSKKMFLVEFKCGGSPALTNKHLFLIPVLEDLTEPQLL